ncbi:MAG: hypothetical protein GX318_02785 [Clostridia bacterium]|nr:hypothetical protein [Clostridia bacterium]
MRKNLSVYTIAAAYIGTVVGAGFATGQEVLQFFGFFGKWGIAGAALSALVFMFYGVIILDLGHRLQAKSYLPIIQEFAGKRLSQLIDYIILFFLFGMVVTMNAGSGAIFTEQFHLPAVWGSLLMAVLTFTTVILGVRRVIRTISFIAPLLITTVILVSLWTVFKNPQGFISNLDWSNFRGAAVPFWPAAAILYGSYNLVLAIPVLAPLGALADQKNIKLGAIFGGLGLGIGVLSITIAILCKVPEIARTEVPMIVVARGVSSFFPVVYSLVLFAEVYTTAAASLYGFTSRLSVEGTNGFLFVSGAATIASVLLARVGFSNLVGTLFPLVGIAGLLLLGTLTYGYLKPRISISPRH